VYFGADTKYKAVEILISCKMKRWPDKVGELLGSMYFFGTLKYLSTLTTIPEKVKWETYGVLAIRSMGTLIPSTRPIIS
jgi:hypothetical protein